MSILSKVSSFIHKTDQNLLGGRGTRFAINKVISEYGEVIELNIDSKSRIVLLVILLKGEDSPIELKINGYEVIKQDDGSSILKIIDASSSKEWVNALLVNFANGQDIEVPADKADFLHDFLAQFVTIQFKTRDQFDENRGLWFSCFWINY